MEPLKLDIGFQSVLIHLCPKSPDSNLTTWTQETEIDEESDWLKYSIVIVM